MKKVRIHFTVSAFVILALLAIVSFKAHISLGQSPASQSPSRKSDSLVKPTVLATDRTGKKKAAPAPFAEAAAQNAALRNELTWMFGSKQQHGWYLYDSLVGQTLTISPDAAASGFASAIAGWQKTKGMAANGVLDETSWMALVAQWQSNRLKDKTPATPDQLLTAPSSDFFDPERREDLRQVEKNTYTAYRQMLTAAIADPTLKLAHTSPNELGPAEK